MFVQIKTWYLSQFEYSKFNKVAHFFSFKPEEIFFWENSVQKIKIACLTMVVSYIWYQDNFEHVEFVGDIKFCWFRLEVLFLT